MHISREDFKEGKFSLEKGERKKFFALYDKVHQSGKPTKRMDTIAKHGYDVKFAYHIVRLLNEVEQILVEHDLDLQRNREQLKSIRRGDWTLEQIETYFEEKELELEKIYLNSTLRYSPDEEGIKKLLIECLEMHYGNLDSAVVQHDKNLQGLKDIQKIIEKVLK